MGSNTTTTQNQASAVNAPFQSNQTTDLVRGPYPPVAGAINSFIDTAAGAQGNVGASYQAATHPYYTNAYTAAASMAPSAYTPWNTALQGMANNGVTADMQPSLGSLGQIASGANNIQTGDLYQQLFNQQQAQAGSSTGLSATQNAILDQNAARLGDQLASKYSGAGRYGSFGAGIGTARGIAETNNPLMAQFQQQNVGNSLSALSGLSNVQQQNIGNQMNAASSQLGAYNAAGQRAGQWAAMAPQLQQVAMAPSQRAYDLYQGYLNSPWTSLGLAGNALSSISPLLSGTGTQTGTQNTSGFQTNTPTGTSTTSQPTPWTTYAGLGLAGIGAAGGMFSDRRLKTDIKKVGKDPWTNLNMYQWRYKGQPKNTPKLVGPMAQDVQKKYPEAVGETAGGILYLKKKVA